MASSTSTNVPKIAAQWIVKQLPSRSGQDWLVERIEQTGVGVLSVKELKVLEESLISITSIIESLHIRYLPKSAKKQRRVDYIRRFFFRDEECTIANDQVIQLIQSEMVNASVSRHATASTTAAASTAAASSASVPETSSNNAAQLNVFAAHYISHAAFAPPNSSSAGNFQMQSNFNPWAEILPKNPMEAHLLSQLLQMGFLRQEILDGIRESENVTPNADEIMLLLIERREEAEEARREDAVRLLSEDQKQVEVSRREQTLQDTLASANTGEDLKVIFPDSWVLTVLMSSSTSNQRLVSTIMNKSRNRSEFVEFLQLEKKSRQWYGWVMPSDYFRKIGTRLKNEIKIDWLAIEREKLRSGLYELKEQEKGEPKIFLNARKTNQSNNNKSSNKNEIICIDDD
ncbi:hypothetical protein FRACYDRAFT_260842 [Fragilariopsis cylindrus CCMP1102]|uniref:UBA domain-containing protein n=1 Tax=Fragilariopsis cylindrus CCMP1102 TaxID=635003 RepID=A0A1E7FGR6_9STRA|nr:hypothetical protein FRACYDRAFT_260842 [Fragilariopsis cylindrus CCMP1102]|eukprot:OEU17369.1 hypothetical protein FRACYDRAFT_260842 [Fragilariopsis cylindrus CCMP1102]